MQDRSTVLLICVLLLSSGACSRPQPGTVREVVLSPDGEIEVVFQLDPQGAPGYRVLHKDAVVIDTSRLGFDLRESGRLDRAFEITDVSRSTFNETWEQPWGESRLVTNHFNELAVDLHERSEPGRRLRVIFRAFDDGIGFRYEFPQQEALEEFVVVDELTEFAFTEPHAAWWIPAYQNERYEYLYRNTPLTEFEAAHTPLTLETSSGLTLTLHEANLTDYASMTLRPTRDNTLECDLVPWSDGTKVRASTPHRTPWRTLQIAEQPEELLESRLILNLNEPNRIEDTEWIRPGKYVGIWWGMHLGTMTWGSGERHGATTERAKKYIDFAAQNGFSGVLVEGWNVGWDGQWQMNGDVFRFTQPYADFDIEEVTRYGAEQGIGLIGHHETSAGIENYESQLEEAFAFYQRLGIGAVKTGYVGDRVNGSEGREWHHGQYMVRHYRKVVERAAEYGIMLDVHEPIKDTGIRRTYPNMMTREGARGQEYDAWAADGGNPPEHATILPFTRMMAGPFDMTPGTFDLLFNEIRANNRVNTTLAKQLALYVVIHSPLHMASDLIENYADEPAFQFIRDVPVDWSETRGLPSRIGDYVTMARKDRNSDDWYLGSVTDENPRMLRVKLGFLEAGKEYVAEVYADGENADWESNPYPLQISQWRVDRSTELEMRMAPSGGQAVRLRPAIPAETHAVERYPAP